MAELKQNEIETLRTLARQCMEMAALPQQRKTRELWLSLNRCAMQRPMVVIDQIPWQEMDEDGALACTIEDGYWQNVELAMRRTLYRWQHMPVDMVVNPYVELPRPLAFSGYGLAVEEETVATDAQNAIVSHKYTNQLQSWEDLEKIKTPVYTLDTGAQTVLRQQAEHIFAGAAPFVFTGAMLHLGLWDSIAMWMGVEDIYIDLIDRPEFLHAIMEKLTAGTETLIEQMNRDGLFDVYGNTCHCSYTFSDDLPRPGCDPDHATSQDAWAFGMAQLFTSVSPAVTDEFEVRYISRLFAHFGAVYYGCCDRLDDRLDVVLKMPNIRKVSCSPWSDREAFAEKLPKGYVMSNKPNPAFLAGARLDDETVRADLRRTIDAARANDTPLEMILKDISTVGHRPQQLWEWARIAMEEACR